MISKIIWDRRYGKKAGVLGPMKFGKTQMTKPEIIAKGHIAVAQKKKKFEIEAHLHVNVLFRRNI